ncbi:hypothetical protein DQ353_19300 [Arthrobacter sp. AQ5-05]|nr:hypothetical protein DQ353_19300 [Arthrobacter sp. AQ5-05]
MANQFEDGHASGRFADANSPAVEAQAGEYFLCAGKPRTTAANDTELQFLASSIEAPLPQPKAPASQSAG